MGSWSDIDYTTHQVLVQKTGWHQTPQCDYQMIQFITIDSYKDSATTWECLLNVQFITRYKYTFFVMANLLFMFVCKPAPENKIVSFKTVV